MKKRLFLFLLAGHFVTVPSWSQNIFKDVEPNQGRPAPKGNHKTSGGGTHGKSGGEAKGNHRNTVEVLFTADMDCLLKIDGRSFGTITAGGQRKIGLAAKTYKVYAESVTTGDVIEEPLKVLPNQYNAFPILMKTAVKLREGRYGGKKDMPEGMDPKAFQVAKELKENMVLLPEGNFKMGGGSKGNDENPVHDVAIGSVYFCKYEVTQQQWEAVMGSNPSGNQGCAACPVEAVSWEEVQTFLSRIDGAFGKKFRLPTEAEWEYAAGKAEEKQIKKTAWHYQNSKIATHPVGSLAADALGLFDLYGNVAEWCSDWYGEQYYKNSPSANPPGPASGQEKVFRGGSFIDRQESLRPSFRGKKLPSVRNKTVGFRVVMEGS